MITLMVADVGPDFFTGWWWLCAPLGPALYFAAGFITAKLHDRYRRHWRTK